MYEIDLIRLWRRPWTAADSEALDRWIMAQRERREAEFLSDGKRSRKIDGKRHYIRKTDRPYNPRPDNCLNCGVLFRDRKEPPRPDTRICVGRGLCASCYAQWRDRNGQIA